MWYEIAIMSLIFAVGNIVFGHFKEKTPKWRRVLKMFVVIAISIIISYLAGRDWFYIFLVCMVAMFLIIHGWWLPKKGINGFTAEPKDKYYEFRGWEKTDS